MSMLRIVSGFGVRAKLAVIVVAAIVGVVATGAFSVASLYDAAISDRQIKVKQLVQVAYSFVDQFHQKVEKGELTLAEGQRRALATLKALRYGGENYFWVNDMHPMMVMHPFKPELDGKDMTPVEDPSGKRLFVAFVERVQQEGEGFVDYQWPRPGADEPVAKLSFVKGFEPWGWIVGSGIYMDDVKQAIWQETWLLGAGAAGLLVLLVVIGWFVARSFLRPIHELQRVMQQVAEDGNLDRLAGVDQNDEIGQMASAFNRLLRQMQQFIVRVQDEVTHLTESGDGLSYSAMQVSHQMATLDEETSQVATAMNQMAASTEEVVRNVEAAAENSRAADRQARTGHEVVGRNLAAIQQLSSGVQEATENVRKLASDAGSIRAIIDVINGIAEQTNLLALNAAIEAARAGDQGRGFAVVADEVRTLAMRTQSSTDEIQQMIEKLNTGAQNTAQVMENCLQQTGESVQRAAEAQQALDAITGAVAAISDMNSQIASAATQQNAVSENINSNITNISTVAGETTHLAEGASQQSASVGSVLTELVATLGQFHSDNDWHYQLAAAKTSHLLWKVRVRGFLDGQVALSTEEAVSHRECKFGKWFAWIAQQNAQLPPSLARVERPHEELHTLVRKIIELKQAGEHTEAQRLFARLEEISAVILRLLDDTAREIGSDTANAA